ncbi:MAG: type II toxin-antitoxin system VapC family toxin [Anaerolineae bacterium]|nr:type II toxin-antitoxin system VapC family toxin [Anaerolineae bacterium]
MPDFLLDSCVLIRHLRQHQPTTDLMLALALDGALGLATISRTEIVEGMRDHERPLTMRLLDSLRAWPLDATIADLAGDYIRCFRAQGIRLDKPDAIIGATAVHHNLILVTYNAKHFPMDGLQLYRDLVAWS